MLAAGGAILLVALLAANVWRAQSLWWLTLLTALLVGAGRALPDRRESPSTAFAFWDAAPLSVAISLGKWAVVAFATVGLAAQADAPAEATVLLAALAMGVIGPHFRLWFLSRSLVRESRGRAAAPAP